MLYTIDGSMQIIHADEADVHFFSKSVVSQKYFLIYIDFSLRKRTLTELKKKLTIHQVISDTESLREYLKREN